MAEHLISVIRVVATGDGSTPRSPGPRHSEIAASLHVSASTVKTHINRLFRKLDIRERVQAVILASETGLVRPGDHGTIH